MNIPFWLDTISAPFLIIPVLYVSVMKMFNSMKFRHNPFSDFTLNLEKLMQMHECEDQ
jgi:hypothetical protein